MHVPANAEAGEAAPGGGRGALPLPPRLDLPYAKTLRELVLARLAVNDLVLDATAVEWLSTPCAQVLLATARAAEAHFRIVGPSEAFRQAVSDLGLDGELRQWMN
ncbi:hypothetical protein CCS01_30870 [Rhodopila globiformis]|uniref:STAS domain-containing protein n=2 Tax=Rhodopila globiformis TaxID=1071 RepID=A0A2S6MV37_RHOGL|nr:hypothetical protein CCS01_30870 [Rhodopila globiformis]